MEPICLTTLAQSMMTICELSSIIRAITTTGCSFSRNILAITNLTIIHPYIAVRSLTSAKSNWVTLTPYFKIIREKIERSMARLTVHLKFHLMLVCHQNPRKITINSILFKPKLLSGKVSNQSCKTKSQKNRKQSNQFQHLLKLRQKQLTNL